MIIEHGSWCDKLNDFITEGTVKKCLASSEKDFKGCAGSKCEFLANRTIIKNNQGEIIDAICSN